MIFNESEFVIANIQIKTPNNIIGSGNIMAVQTSEDKVFDFINYKEYEIIKDINNLKEGIYVEILNRPFKESNKMVSADIFQSHEFKKYIKQFEKNQEEISELLENPEYVHKEKLHHCENKYSYSKIKTYKKRLP